MSEKPFKKPEDGEVIPFPRSPAQVGTGPASSRWIGTDLARFAQDVIALNRQVLSPEPKVAETQSCQVASLESLQRGLKIKKKTAEETSQGASVEEFSRFRKE